MSEAGAEVGRGGGGGVASSGQSEEQHPAGGRERRRRGGAGPIFFACKGGLAEKGGEREWREADPWGIAMQKVMPAVPSAPRWAGCGL